MTLNPCPECQNPVSDSVATCAFCGCVANATPRVKHAFRNRIFSFLKGPYGYLVWVSIAVVLLVVIGVASICQVGQTPMTVEARVGMPCFTFLPTVL